MQLRYLQTLNGIATEQNSTIIFPVPIDLFSIFQNNQFNSTESSTNLFSLTPTKSDNNHHMKTEILIPTVTSTDI
jgi:hypothetical protein